jgi:DNA-directed RNA polymerase subunit RPC12/RpoP
LDIGTIQVSAMGLFDIFKNFFRKPHSHINNDHSIESHYNNAEFTPVGINEYDSIKESASDECDFPDVYICRTCGKKFDSAIDLENHHKLQSGQGTSSEGSVTSPQLKNDVVIPQVQEYNELVNPADDQGFVCRTCGEKFQNEYDLLNHDHRLDDRITLPDDSPTISVDVFDSPSQTNIDTQFINWGEVNVTNLGPERLQYDHFPGKIGYTWKK